MRNPQNSIGNYLGPILALRPKNGAHIILLVSTQEPIDPKLYKVMLLGASALRAREGDSG